jgi:hypothetical protein
MIPAKEKAKELVSKYVHLAKQSTGANGTIYNSKKCAAYAVGTILDEYQPISDLESTLVVNGEVMSIVDKIVYWNEVKREIIKL